MERKRSPDLFATEELSQTQEPTQSVPVKARPRLMSSAGPTTQVFLGMTSRSMSNDLFTNIGRIPSLPVGAELHAAIAATSASQTLSQGTGGGLSQGRGGGLSQGAGGGLSQNDRTSISNVVKREREGKVCKGGATAQPAERGVLFQISVAE